MTVMDVAAARLAEVPASPCVDVCRMDDATGWCAGCLRTLDEIAGWSRLDTAAKRAVLAALPPRELEWRRLHGRAAGADPPRST